MTADRKILVPYHHDEVIWLKEAAALAGASERTLQLWCERYGLGRRIGWRWHVSRVALAMHLDGNREALAAYHVGVRTGVLVGPYYDSARVNSQTPQTPQTPQSRALVL